MSLLQTMCVQVVCAGRPTVIVAMAAYRDAECHATLANMFQQVPSSLLVEHTYA